jgi:hypothetical protein
MKVDVARMAVLLLLLFQNCSNPELRREDFVGTWKSNDGAVIELREDGSYSAKRINYYNYFSEVKYENKRFDFDGRWKILDHKKLKQLELQSDVTFKDLGINSTYMIDGRVYSHNIGITFEISGQGLLEDTPPWYLFVWIGDPDSVNKYRFEKQ